MKWVSKCLTAAWGLGLGLMVVGCSSLHPTADGISVPKEKSAEMKEFDQKLGEITDSKSAENAVDFFVAHVRKNLNSTVSGSAVIQSTQFRNLVSRMAAVESVARGHSTATLKILSEDDLVSPEKLAEVLSETAGPGEVQRTISEEEIKITQEVVRKNIPHLATSDDLNMTPLEASVLAYYMMTGDIGDPAADATNQLHASDDDLATFASKIQDGGIQ